MDREEVESTISESEKDVFQVFYDGNRLRLNLIDVTFDEVFCVVFSRGSTTYRAIERSNAVFLEKYSGIQKRFVELGVVEDIK